MSLSTTTYASAECLACRRNYGASADNVTALCDRLNRDGWWSSAFLKVAVCNDCRTKLARIKASGIPFSEVLPQDATPVADRPVTGFAIEDACDADD